MNENTRHMPLLDDVAHEMEHVLPGQASIRDFVHHNTLHGFQDLDFPDAVQAVQRMLGLRANLPVALFTSAFRRGRVTDADVRAAITEYFGAEAGSPVAADSGMSLSHADVYHSALLTPPSTPAPAALQWRIKEYRSMERLQAGVSTKARARLLERAAANGLSNEAMAIRDLWLSCTTVVAALAATRGEAESPVTPAIPPDVELDSEELESLWSVRRLKKEGVQLLVSLLARVGVDWTLRDLLLVLTGEDLLEAVREHMVRHAASHLDEGLAAWHNPGRRHGFYRAWCESALQEQSWILGDFPEWHQQLERLPDTARQAVNRELELLGLAPERWLAYLRRLALELPGWAGMFKWREQHPGYAGLEDVPVELMDYLAVRLVLERIHAQRVCRKHWQLEASLSMLKWYFNRHPAELIVRNALYGGAFKEALVGQAERLVGQARDQRGEGNDQEWHDLALRVLDVSLLPTGASEHAWPIFVLAQYLGLAGADIHALGESGVAALQTDIARLDEDTAGYLRLLAYERHYREQIFATLIANHGRGDWPAQAGRASAQLIFCMDDREEGTRRHLEELAPQVQTFGAAGFFGVAVNWRGLDDARPSALCPVVVVPTHDIDELPAATELYAAHTRRRRVRFRVNDWLLRTSHRGALSGAAAVALGAFMVLPALAGRVLAPRLTGSLIQRLRNRFDLRVPTRITLTADADAPPPTVGKPRLGYSDAEQVDLVAGLLRAIGLTRDFSPLVILFGHGSTSVNNPHAAAYDCGACSGRHGGPNARAFAAMANRSVVRERLAERGIVIPAESWFLGGEHNTCDDSIVWYDRDTLPAALDIPLQELESVLRKACRAHALERCRRFASAPRRATPARAERHVTGRSHDLSQTRPELGHVANACAFIGRRSMSRGAFFDRRAFLISYDAMQDPEGNILETILNAAGPVSAGINLEYYFSTVNNERLGCGTKVMHNITGFLGVMDGGASDLRTGLPSQMIEIHEPMRLLIVIEARTEVIDAIYDRQPVLRELIGNGWVRLAAKDPAAAAIQLFSPRKGWLHWEGDTSAVARAVSSEEWYRGQMDHLLPALLERGLPPLRGDHHAV